MGHDVLIAQLDTVRVIDIPWMGVGASSNSERRELFMLFIFSYFRRHLVARKKPRIRLLHLFACVCAFIVASCDLFL